MGAGVSVAGAGLCVRGRGGVVLGLVLGLVLSGCSSGPGESPAGPVNLGDPHDFALALFDAANAERSDAGLAELAWSECLADAAAPRAAASLGTAPLTHEPLPSPCTPGATAGENLSRTWRTASEVVELWMESEAHRANILNPAFTHSGISCIAYSHEDPARGVEGGAEGGAEQGGMVCSELFEGS